jgi:4Fe-4S ferredoxin
VNTETCKHVPGTYEPRVDRNRCEGEDDCVRVCPFAVFEVRSLTRAERDALPVLSRLKLAIHGNRQAFTVKAGQCQACGLCVKACPERAITLMRVGS